MKKVLVLFCFLMVANFAHGESYLIVSKATNEILSLSPEDDAQLPDNTFEKIVIDEDYWDIALSEHPTMYKYKDKKFIKNIEKISNVEIEKENAIVAGVRHSLIMERVIKIAEDELIAEGVIE